MPLTSPLRAAAPLAVAAALLFSACGSDDDDDAAGGGAAARRRRRLPRRAPRDYAAIKDYLPEHTARSEGDGHVTRGRREYYAMAEGVDFDYAKLLRTGPREVAGARRAGARRPSRRPTRPTSRWRASSPASPSSPTST